MYILLLGFSLLLGNIGRLSLVGAQFPPEPEDLQILHSRFDDGVYISYKEVGFFGVTGKTLDH